jgi:chromosome segregation ATPase
MSKLRERERQQHGVDISPGRRALRRQKLTNMLSDLRAKEFLNLGLHRGDLDVLDEDKEMMQVMSQNHINPTASRSLPAQTQSPPPQWVFRGTGKRAAPRQLSMDDSPAALSQERQRLLRTSGPASTNDDDTRTTAAADGPSDDRSDRSVFNESPRSSPQTTNTMRDPITPAPSSPRHVTGINSESITQVLEKGARQRVTALNTLRLDWAGHIDKTERDLNERQSELQQYESKLASEALRLRHSSEQVKYQFDDMQAQSESFSKVRAELEAARHTLELRERDLDSRERQLDVRSEDLSTAMARMEARESDMRANQAKLAELAAQTNHTAAEARDRDVTAQQAHIVRMGEIAAEETRLRTAADHVSGLVKAAETQRTVLEQRVTTLETRERACVEREKSQQSVAAEVLATQRAVRQSLAALLLTQQQLIQEISPLAEKNEATVTEGYGSNYSEIASFTDVLIAHDRTLRAVNSQIDSRMLSLRECQGSTSAAVAKLHGAEALHRERAARLETLGTAVEAQSAALRHKENELAERETTLEATVNDCRSLGERLERRERHVQETIANLASREERVQTAENALREREEEHGQA